MSYEQSFGGQSRQLSFERTQDSIERDVQPRSSAAASYGNRALLGVAMSLNPDGRQSFLQAAGTKLAERPAEFRGFPTSNSENTPFYLGRELRQDTAVGTPSRYPTSEQTLTPGGWKYDGTKED